MQRPFRATFPATDRPGYRSFPLSTLWSRQHLTSDSPQTIARKLKWAIVAMSRPTPPAAHSLRLRTAYTASGCWMTGLLGRSPLTSLPARSHYELARHKRLPLPRKAPPITSASLGTSDHLCPVRHFRLPLPRKAPLITSTSLSTLRSFFCKQLQRRISMSL
jgi:hypothetical protein